MNNKIKIDLDQAKEAAEIMAQLVREGVTFFSTVTSEGIVITLSGGF